MKSKKTLSPNFYLILSVAISCVFVVWFAFSVFNASEMRSEKELYDLELSIRRAVASCYAMEGSYPQSLEYLEKHYGIQIDYKKYSVFYEIFADNIMPDITVLERNDEK